MRYEAGEGLAVSFAMDRRVIELCDAVASAGQGHRRHPSARPLRWGFATDALPVRLARYPCTTITTIERGALLPASYHRLDDLPDRVDPGALDRVQSFALDLVRALDRDVGRRCAGDISGPSTRPPPSHGPASSSGSRRRRASSARR